MIAMNIQDRYKEIAELSGLSEQVIRTVLKAAQQSLSKSLRQGNNATLPGICTIYPEMRSRLEKDKKDENGPVKYVQYIKLKAKASSALETEFNKVESFEKPTDKDEVEVQDISSILKLEKPELHFKDRYSSGDGIRTKQIGALQ